MIRGLLDHARTNASATVKLIAAALVGALLATGGYALAAGNSKTIHGCVEHGSGILHIQSRCGRGETRLLWNQQGPTGPQGKTGPAGAASPIVTAWAAVGSTGTVLGGSGVVVQHTGTGTYNVQATPTACAQTTDAAAINVPNGTVAAGSFPEGWAGRTGGNGDFTVQTGVVAAGAFTAQDNNFDITISC